MIVQLKRNVGCALVLCTVLSSSGCVAEVGDAEDSEHEENLLAEGIVLQSPEEAAEEDLQLIAKSRGWTLDEAADHLAASEAVGKVAAEIATHRPDIFVGSAVSAPGEAPKLYLKGRAGDDVMALVRQSEVPIDVIDDQPHSFEELEARASRAHDAILALGFDNVSTSFDFKRQGAIESIVQRRAGMGATPDALMPMLPADVRGTMQLKLTDEGGKASSFSVGGMRTLDDGWPECTAGWTVVHNPPGGSLKYGILSAGHCKGINGIWHEGVPDHTMSAQSEHVGQYGDFEWYTTNAAEPAQFFSSNGNLRDTLAVEHWASITVGETVCFFSRLQSARTCAFVDAVGVTHTVEGKTTAQRQVRMDRNPTIEGDSGGGWSFNNTAFGVHRGWDAEDRAVWSVANLIGIALAFNLQVRIQ